MLWMGTEFINIEFVKETNYPWQPIVAPGNATIVTEL